MKRVFLSIVLYSFLVTSNSYSDGKVKIKSDTKGAYIYIDNVKRAMVGDGYTTITLLNGEHKILVQKEIDGNTYLEGSDNIFVGENTEIELFIKLKSIKTGKPLVRKSIEGDYICILGGSHGVAMKIKEKSLVFHMYNQMYRQIKDITSKYELIDKKIYTNINGKKFFFRKNNNQLISSDKKFPVVCGKKSPLEKQQKISKQSDIIGKWKHKKNNAIYEFKKNGKLISSVERKGKIVTEHSKWLLNNKNTLMMTAPPQQSNDYVIITKFRVDDSKKTLSMYKDTEIFEKIK